MEPQLIMSRMTEVEAASTMTGSLVHSLANKVNNAKADLGLSGFRA